MVLTTAMIISSLFGYVTLGCAVAAFIPLIVINAVQRRNGTSALFLYVWLVADALNLIGIFLLGAQITQIALAGFYFIADGLLLIELFCFGHADWGAPSPQPSKALVRSQAGRRGRRWEKFCVTFYSFSVWDSAKLLVSCVLAGISWWGLYTVYQLQVNPDYEIEHKTETTTLSFAIGLSGSVTFTAARIPELWLGWRRSNRGEKPEHALDDLLFYALVMENVFNLVSILSLSTDPDYLFAELPWIFGSVAPILLDFLMLVSIAIWLRKWQKSPRKTGMEQEVAERQAQLDRLDDERYKLVMKFRAQDVKAAALEVEKEAPADAGWYTRWGIKRYNKKLAAIRQDLYRHETALNEMIIGYAEHYSLDALEKDYSLPYAPLPLTSGPPSLYSVSRPLLRSASRDGSDRRRSLPPRLPEFDEVWALPLNQYNHCWEKEREGAV